MTMTRPYLIQAMSDDASYYILIDFQPDDPLDATNLRLHAQLIEAYLALNGIEVYRRGDQLNSRLRHHVAYSASQRLIFFPANSSEQERAYRALHNLYHLVPANVIN